jgi:glucose/arabinose dehydrogenase
MRTAVIALVAIAVGCEDEDGGGMQQPPPGMMPPPTGEPLGRVGLELVADGFTSPVLLAEAPDDTGRLFVVDQTGVIQIIDAGGQTLDAPFLDIRDRMVDLMDDFDERGLLGLAFHPDFATNGRLYVYYSAPLREEAPDEFDHTSHISEFTVTANGDQVDLNSERILLQVDEPQFNHNGGMLAFGPDGYLYISLGDGGGANDVGPGHSPMGNAQDLEMLLGKVLRIDVDGGEPYGIPSDNPFVGTDGRDEIWAYGFRNPFRFSFDLENDNRMFLGDAGQNRWEEVDIVERGGNYGWNIREGAHCFNPQSPDEEPAMCPETGARGEQLIDPILEYQNANVMGGLGLVVIGGFVYRGDAIPELQGDYVFGDFGSTFEMPSGLLFAATESEDGTWEMRPLEIANDAVDAFVRAFGQDRAGEIYVLTAASPGPTGTTGSVYRIVAEDAVPEPPVGDVTAQIEQGGSLFGQNCARCHGEAGMGTAIAPPLVGEGALPLDPRPTQNLRTTQFRTARDVYDFARTFMPLDMPGALTDQAYLDIVAFALDANGIMLSEVLTEENAGEIVINQPQE